MGFIYPHVDDFPWEGENSENFRFDLLFDITQEPHNTWEYKCDQWLP